MSQTDYPEQAKRVAALAATKISDVYFTSDDVYVVWFCYILGGWKALVSTPVEDGRYYEVTYNHEKNERYVDVFKREVGWVHVPDHFSGELKANPMHPQLEDDPSVYGCSNHVLIQHRDGKEPWCENCKRNVNGVIPSDPFR